MSESRPLVADAVIDRLRAAGCVYAEEEAALLLDQAADDAELAALIDRRVAGEPLEQIVGWAEFCGLRLSVRPGVFVPRRRTELLVREAVARCRPGAIVVDLCCGVGAVGIAISRALPSSDQPDLYATDIDPIAIDCARQNGVRRALVGDLFEPLPPELRGRVAVITANAPYVPSDDIALMPTEARDHEAPAALDGGMDGLDLHRRICAEAPSWLAAGGALLIETGRPQVATDLRLLLDSGLEAGVRTDDDLSGTVVIGTFTTGQYHVRRG